MSILMCQFAGCNDADISTGISYAEELEKLSADKNDLSAIFDNNTEKSEKESDDIVQSDNTGKSNNLIEPEEEVKPLEEPAKSSGDESPVIAVTDVAKSESYGDSSYDGGDISVTDNKTVTYVLNKNTKKFHYQHCSSASQIKTKNKGTGTDRAKLIAQGYKPCKVCNP